MMRIYVWALLTAGLSLLAWGDARPEDERGPTLFFAGDSTLDDHGVSLGGSPAEPYRSWGSELIGQLRPGCRIVNCARSGCSTRSFRNEGRWDRLIAEVRPGDFVAIQFGHNDQKRTTEKARAELWSDPKGLFRTIVREWVADVRAKGATPILLSPICRATFDAEGKRLVDVEHASDGVCLGSYREAMRELSAELGCDFIDMNALTRGLLEREGREKAYRYFAISSGLVRAKDGEPIRDTTHPVQAGATAFARLFLDDVRRRNLPVAGLFRRDFPITVFGASTNGVKCTAAFARAIEACSAAGGGRVVVPAGKWFTGSIRLRSDVELHLDSGAEVVFSQDPADYLPAVHTSWEGMECWNYCPLVYAYCCTNVALTGTGTLRAYEGEWKDTAWYPWVAQENGVGVARRQLYDWGATDFPVGKREIWRMKDAHTRPHFVQFNRCKNVRWEGFRVRNSPFWTLHLYLCEDAEVRGLDVYAHGNNNDGIDIEMSRNVLVENCTFDQGDDGVVIKSGRNRDAWRLATPTENVLVRNCRIVRAHTVLGVGSEISGGVRNVRMVDCEAGDVWRAVFLKTNRRRGGFLEDIEVANVRVRSARFALVALSTDTLYEWKKFPDYELRDTRIDGLTVHNVTAERAGRRLDIVGEARLPVRNVRLTGVRADAVAEPDRVENVVGLADVSAGETWGGYTFDFKAQSDRHFVIDVPPERNLVSRAGPWELAKPHVYMWPKDLPDDAPVRARVRAGDGVRSSESNGVFRVENLPRILELCDGDRVVAGATSSHFSRSFPVPDGQTGGYRFACRFLRTLGFRGKRPAAWTLTTYDGPEGRQLSRYNKNLPTDSWGDANPVDMRNWVDCAGGVDIPAGARWAKIDFELPGVGSLAVRDVSLSRLTPASASKLEVRNSIPDLIDGTFAVSENQCGVISYEWRRLAGSIADRSKVVLELALPPCVRYAGNVFAPTGEVSVVFRPDGGSVVRLPTACCAAPAAEYNRWHPFGILLKAAAASGASGKGSFRVLEDGVTVSNVEDIRFEIIPEIRVAAPRRYRNGCCIGNGILKMTDDASLETYARFLSDAGVRWVHGQCARRERDALRRAGVSKYTLADFTWFHDGFKIGPPAGRPADERFVSDQKGQPFEGSVCPISVYEESDFFRTNTVPFLRKWLTGSDGLWSNWELWQYVGHGCWCDRCRAAFAKYAGVSEDEVRAVWPKEMMKGGSWEMPYVNFRSVEHGKLVKTLDKYVREATGGADSDGLIPGVVFANMVSGWREREKTKSGFERSRAECREIDFAGTLKWINPWGPYPANDLTMPFAPLPGGGLVYFAAAKDVREQVNRDYPLPNRPKLLAYPHGMQCNVWIAQPEEISMALDSFFFNRWEASVVYFFPRGYDARYWRAFAEATERAAKYEEFVLDGERCDEAVTLGLTAPYPPNVPSVTSRLPNCRNLSCLQKAVYDLGDRRVVAVLNFASDMSARFRIKTRMPSGRYVVRNEKDEDLLSQSVTARQLETQGVELCVPAARTRAFEIVRVGEEE